MAIALRNRAGTTLTDASYRAGFGELIDNTRTVFANYVVKVLPMPPYGPDVYGAIGSWAGAAVIAVVVALWLIRMGSSRVRTTGLLTFVCTLAPSLLTRAAVSVMNFPTFRQLYLPLAGVGLLLCAWRPAGFRRMGSWVAGGVVLALVVLYKTPSDSPATQPLFASTKSIHSILRDIDIVWFAQVLPLSEVWAMHPLV